MEQRQKWVNKTFFNTDCIQNTDVAMEKGFVVVVVVLQPQINTTRELEMLTYRIE